MSTHLLLAVILRRQRKKTITCSIFQSDCYLKQPEVSKPRVMFVPACGKAVSVSLGTLIFKTEQRSCHGARAQSLCFWECILKSSCEGESGSPGALAWASPRSVSGHAVPQVVAG